MVIANNTAVQVLLMLIKHLLNILQSLLSSESGTTSVATKMSIKPLFSVVRLYIKVKGKEENGVFNLKGNISINALSKFDMWVDNDVLN
jgi:hypothetical protein